MKKKQALNEKILLNINKPGRYIGNEINSIKKNINKIDIRFAICFPDIYEIGMSYFGIQILYNMLNKKKYIWCERVFSPWFDLDIIMRKNNIQLFTLESQDSIKLFDFLGITIQYELNYTNILQILDLSHIPFYAKYRNNKYPIIIGGGPCVYNPEPLVNFFDIFYVGDAEVSLLKLLKIYKRCKKLCINKNDFLKYASNISGIYVPKFYNVSYNLNKKILSFYANKKYISNNIKRQIYFNFTNNKYYPIKPIIPFIKIIQDHISLEIQRGCIYGCRFCQAGMINRPFREYNVSFLKKIFHLLLKNTGYEEISLNALSLNEYSKIKKLIEYIIKKCLIKNINIVFSSLRIDKFSLNKICKINNNIKNNMTFAIESGTQRMRDIINKGLTEKKILNKIYDVFKFGINKIKLYFMIGFPNETVIDIQNIIYLVKKIIKEYHKIYNNNKYKIIINTSIFVPKPFTPFQFVSMCYKKEYKKKIKIIKNKINTQLNKKNIKYNYCNINSSLIEGVLSKGNRKLNKIIELSYKNGAIFDSWSEYFNYNIWQKSLKKNNINKEFYINNTYSFNEILPWDFIDIGITKSFLYKELIKSRIGIKTLNCKIKCSNCGLSCFKRNKI